MEPIKVDEILQATKGKLLSGNKDTWIPDISTDSRQIREGDLFIALKGDKFDGHNFIEEVMQKQASGLIISKEIPITDYRLPITIIKVTDTLVALGKIAAYYRQKFKIPVVAITGSNGKTTTKEMAATLLAKKFNTLRSKSSFNNAIGVPLTLFELNKTTQAVVLEIGMNHPGEIKYLSEIANQTAALITNIGESHIGYLKTKENIASEKMKILEPAGIAILNRDDVYLSKIKFNGKLITYGIHNEADITAQNLHQNMNGVEFTLNNRYHLSIPILGRHNVYNILAATAIAYALGLTFEEIEKGYGELKTPYGRMELSSLPGGTKIINDAYNANPTSMKCALETLSQIQTDGQKILVMGDMLELGDLSQSFHQTTGKEIANYGINILFTIGDNASLSADEACRRGVEVYKCGSNDEIISKLKKLIQLEDIILVKGSRRMKLEEVVEGLK
ncbi:MAG: UDP-N-acetylmuramoyl-tripeptide--D-alanyl-D-alanine ligase [bacterium]